MIEANIEEVEVKENPDEVGKPEEDPVLGMVVELKMLVKDVNRLLSLLAQLPYNQSSEIINVIRNEALTQVESQVEELRNKSSKSAE